MTNPIKSGILLIDLFMFNTTSLLNGPTQIEPDNQPSEGATPSPKSPMIPFINPSTVSPPISKSLHVVMSDPRAISSLVEQLLSRSGLTMTEVSKRLGCSVQSVAQYKYGRRANPSITWLVRLAEVCGGKITLEMPTIKLGTD